jgi:protein-S-isoprenylcysteine O-methyltransferase Ste14
MIESAAESNRDRRVSRIFKVWTTLMGAAWLVGPFVAAGTVRWPAIWLYIGTIALGALVQRIYVSRRNPAILARRRVIGAGTKGWDLAWAFVMTGLVPLSPIIAGVGVRAGWPAMPAPFAVIGVLANSASGVVWARAMASNAHFESTVRIQREVGHTVVDRGPYRIVRHPGYAAFCVGSLGAPFMLLSWPALVIGPLLAAWFVLRTALEDKTLQRELAGYADYARRVRFRLVPGVW